MRPLHVRKEVPGFIADRLLEALWREALHLVNDGVATTGEIDDAIRFGAGLRWSFMGSFLTYTLAGGPAGMRHFMAQFGPALKLPWTYLQAPELTEGLIDAVVEGTAEQQGERSLDALERYRVGGRKNALMQPFATQLKPEDIRALAEFYSRQQPSLKTVPLRENVVTGQK